MDRFEAQRRLLKIKGIKIKRRVSVPDADPFESTETKAVNENCARCNSYSYCVGTRNYKYLSEELKSRCPWYSPKEK